MSLLFAVLLVLVSRASSKNVVQFNVTKGLPGIHVGSAPSLARRGTHAEQLINNISGGGYYVSVKVGTPGQKLTMLLDTGSSDAWVLGHEADLCTDQDLQHLYGMPCTDTYDPSKSASNKLVKANGFRITYLDGGTASGDYITEDFAIGGITVKSLQMAYVTKAVRGTGILGLGFSISERASTKYPNIIDEMSDQGLISSKAYSLYLNDRRTDSGSLLFGGIDTDKFIGPLSILPMYKPPGGYYSSFEVNFTAVSFTYANGTEHTIPTSILDHPAPAVLDSGSTLSYLPDEMTQPIHAALGTTYSPDLRMTLIDCAHLHTPSPTGTALSHLTFTFSPTTTITVPLRELILDILPPSYSTEKKGSRACVFGIQSTALFSSASDDDDDDDQPSSNFTLLGDTFLRSAYVVYDLTHYQIGLAQANLNSTTSTVVELSSSSPGTETTGLPRLTGVSAQQTTFTPTSTAGANGGPNGGGAGTDPERNAAAGGGAGLGGRMPVREVVAVAVVTGVFTLLGGALVAF
ncbi:aspartic peptidase domain-containing protein [Parachaetomium inaequale]|uniref:Aspartic peptidase domain-containing protein n=1 Tax=Parachaetomium inaequale TaxID=2588326 RepID=A0AAN6P765_9PEZI|nr:aspartic peptidase domain-containing protein [Parachaetomium inaequale]